MKKLINDPNMVVVELLEGLVAACPELGLDPEVTVVYRKTPSEKVGLVSGGGSGHEPAHAGYVGYGMLDAAVAGNVFASPSPDQIIEGIKHASTGKGVLLVIKNYSGDIMNFTMAKELAEMEGIEVDSVVVRDDVAVEDSTYSAGRRGIAGTVLVHKIAGAKAEQGASLAEVKAVAEKAIANIRTMGMAMSSATLPAVGKPNFSIGDDEIEIGMGIHGEPGIHRSTIMSSREVTRTLLDKVFADHDFDGAEVCLMVNGMGATPLMELLIVNKDAHDYLNEKGIKVYKTYVGNYMTSLEMAGCSVTLMKMDEELKALLDFPAWTPSFKEGAAPK